MRSFPALLAAAVLCLAASRAAAAISPIPRYGQAVALLTDGRILVVGGSDSNNLPMASVEILDTTRGSEFVPTTPVVPVVQPEAVFAATSLTTARSSATITVLPNGKVLVTGGWDGASARSDAEVYDPLGNSWVVVVGMSSGRFNHTATLLNTGKVLVCGGQTGAAAVVTASCDLFTPLGAGGSFAPTGSMLQARALHTATNLIDGTVWAAGGWNPTLASGFVVTTERYSPATGQWAQTAPLNAERAYHTATLTGDNKVLVVGGYNGRSLTELDTTPPGYGHTFGFLNSTEIFDPIGGSIIPGPPMQARAMTHTTTLRPEGTLSVFGGIGNILSTLDNQTITLNNGAFVSVGGGAATATFGPTAPANTTITLGTPVSGTIIEGDLEFVSPVLKFPTTGLTVSFTASDPNNTGIGLRMSLNGATVGCLADKITCGKINGTFPFVNMGQNSFTPTLPVTVIARTPLFPVTTGYLNFSPTTMDETINGGITNVLSGSFTTHVQVPVPSYLKGQVLNTISLALSASNTASFTETSSYTVTLTSGTGVGPGPGTTSGPYTVLADGSGGFYVDIASMTFNSVSGLIAVLSPPPYTLKSPLSVPLSGIAPAMSPPFTVSESFSANAVDLCEDAASGPPNCATIAPATGTNAYVVIKDMVFGDNEYFVPKTNQWAFQPPGFIIHRPGTAVTGPSGLVTQSGDEFDIGGRTYSATSGTFGAKAGNAGNRSDQGTAWNPSDTVAAGGADAIPAHAFHTANLLPNGTIMLAGGTDGVNVLTAAETFDPASGSYTLAGSMKVPREYHSASLLPNGRVLVAGGFTTSSINTGPTNTTEIYYPDTRLFLPAAVMISSRSQHVAISLPDGDVFVAGGYDGLTTVSNSAEIYQSTTNTWIPAANMPGGQQRAIAAAVQLKDGTIMVCGGANQTGILNTVLIYNPANNAWTTLGELMPSPLQSHTATLLFDGRVLVVGGDDGFGETTSSFLYDPAQPNGSRWSYTYPLTDARLGHSATLLPNGSVMISGGVALALLGGNSNTNALKTIEVFHPAFDDWSNLTKFAAPRAFHTATLAPNGRVYFIGGANGSIGAAQSASFYSSAESTYFTMPPDQEAITPGQRQSTITFTTPSPFLPGSLFEVKGLRFRGATEASGGAGGPGNPSFNSPRLMLQKIDGSSAGGAESSPGFVADLTSAVYANAGNLTTLDTDLTVTLPANNALPYGWYAPWVGANDIHTAQSPLVQVGPPLPPSPVTNLAATSAGIFSVTYNWTAPAGSYDGYDIYSATSGIFIATVSAPTTQFTLTNLVPNTTAQIRIAPYTITGDGPLTDAATSYTLSTSPINVQIASVTFNSLLLQWNSNGNTPGTVYEVSESTDSPVPFATSASTPVPTILGLTTTFVTITGLVNNSTYSFRIRSFNTAGVPSGFSSIVSTQTRNSVSGVGCGPNRSGDTTTSIQWGWVDAGAVIKYNVYDSSNGVLLGNSASGNPNFSDVGLGTNTQRSIMVTATTAAGEGPLSGSATCYTQAATPGPGSPLMTSTETTSVSMNWTNNGNPNGTQYLVKLYSAGSTTTLNTSGFVAYFSGLSPVNYYSAQVFGLNQANFPSAPLAMGTTYTLPAQPQPLTIQGTTPNSIFGSWNSNFNSTMTAYQLTYSLDNFATNNSTAIFFASGYNASTFTITRLLTSTQYWVRVQADNPLGQRSQFSSSVSTITFNGGAPPGSLAGTLTALGASEFSGNLGDGTFIDMRSPGGAFPTDTVVTVSTYDVSGAGHGPLCPNGVINGVGAEATAFSITDNPAFQPTHPLMVNVSYTPAEILGPVSQVALSRFDPVSRTCVPLETTFNTLNKTFTAKLNHFSLYQLVQIPLATTAGTARIFPNPYRAATDGYITIDQVPPGSRVRVFTLRGERILDATANEAGIVTWAADNSAGRPVASGLYLVEVESGGTKKLLKLAVIR